MHDFFPNTLHMHVQLLKNLCKNPKFWVVLCADLLLLAVSLWLSYAIRFDFKIPHLFLRQCIALLPLVLGIKIPSFYLLGLYRGMWRFTSFNDIVNVLLASLFSSALIISVILVENRFTGYSRSVFSLDCLLTFCLIAGHRAAIRFYYQQIGTGEDYGGLLPHRAKKRLLLIGSDSATEKVLREIRENKRSPYVPVGLVADDPKKVGLKLHDIPVLGVLQDLKRQALRTHAQEILIATMQGDRQHMHAIVQACQMTGLPYKVLPTMRELISGKVSVNAIRDISYKDLLGRDEVHLDQEKIGAYLSGKTVLITGAGGSIGSELCRQVLRFNPSQIILYDASEENLYRVQMEIRHGYDNIQTAAVLGQIQDLRLLNHTFGKYRPSVVFHTAAYKHVPLVERNPWEAVFNNILATQILIEAAILYRADRFVLVSTDKAVRPTNVMGASKRVTELLMLAYCQGCWDGYLSPAWSQAELPDDQNSFCRASANMSPPHHATRFMGVRFGNVLGSSGSVIPLFKRQIERGGPVTVTHPEVTRYFMSAEEAAQLILQSGSMGEGGEIFILKMGAPIKIAQMARELIHLSGHEADTEIKISYIGLRAGEKLYEELITQGEGIVDTSHEKIMVLHGEQTFSCTNLSRQLAFLAQRARDIDSKGIKKGLQDIVPEYQPDYTT